MKLFFFGTLMDEDVRRVVIGPRQPQGLAEPAILHGFRCVHVAGRNYPMILHHPPGRVEGLLVHALSAEAVSRLSVFEGPEYHLLPLHLSLADGHLVRAGVFVCDRAVVATQRAWTLEAWQRRHKRAFLRRAAMLMDHYGTQAMLRRTAAGLPTIAPKEPKRLSGMRRGLGRRIAG